MRSRIARISTEILAPAPVAAALLALISWHTTATPQQAILWGALAILFAALIPMLYVLEGVHRRRLSSRHVPIREQRRTPLIVGIVSVLVGFVVIDALGAPRAVVALVVSMLAGLVISLVVTIFWKVSIHTAVVAGSVVILALVFGPILLIASIVVALIAWSRVELGDHSIAQVVGGAVLGAAVAAAVFPLALQ